MRDQTFLFTGIAGGVMTLMWLERIASLLTNIKPINYY